MKRNRGGFSLIELLVVMTIIAIVTAFLLGGGLGAFGAGRIAATRATISKIDSILSERMDQLRKDPLRGPTNELMQRWAAASPPNSYPLSEKNAEAIARKIAFRSAFPQRLEDCFGADSTIGGGDDSPILTTWLSKTGGVLRPPGHQTKNESAKLLYLIIQTGLKTEITDSVNPRHIAYLDPSDKSMELPAIVDDWGNPLRFYGWPTRLVRPAGPPNGITQSVFNMTAKPLLGLEIPATPSPIPYPATGNTAGQLTVCQDPFDPKQSYATFAASTTIDTAPFNLASMTYNAVTGLFSVTGQRTCPPLDINQFYDPYTYHAPLIMSAGEDGEFGLELPTVAGPGRLGLPLANSEELIADNLTNQQK